MSKEHIKKIRDERESLRIRLFVVEHELVRSKLFNANMHGKDAEDEFLRVERELECERSEKEWWKDHAKRSLDALGVKAMSGACDQAGDDMPGWAIGVIIAFPAWLLVGVAVLRANLG